MVRLRSLKDDFYKLDDGKLSITGERTKKKYSLGDNVKIRVLKVDVEKRQIDYVLV